MLIFGRIFGLVYRGLIFGRIFGLVYKGGYIQYCMVFPCLKIKLRDFFANFSQCHFVLWHICCQSVKVPYGEWQAQYLGDASYEHFKGCGLKSLLRARPRRSFDSCPPSVITLSKPLYVIDDVSVNLVYSSSPDFCEPPPWSIEL